MNDEERAIRADERLAAESANDRAAVLDKLKGEINASLWTRLPGSLTLDRAEEVAVTVHAAIEDTWVAQPTSMKGR